MLPVGNEAAAPTGIAQLRYRTIGDVGERIDAAYRASVAYLDAAEITGTRTAANHEAQGASSRAREEDTPPC